MGEPENLDETTSREARAINFSWLIRLRWGTAIGQLAIILIVHGLMQIHLPLAWLFALVGVAGVSNAVATWRVRRGVEVQEWMLVSLMTLDVLVLTGLLLLTGGPVNPFSFLYLIYVALAAVVLRPGWMWGLSAFSLACFGALFFLRTGSPPSTTDDHGHMRMHLQGMWVAFGVAAAFIVYFVHRVTTALSERERELRAARETSARSEKLASLATLAAGAAHELATPLSTIAVVTKELERGLDNGSSSDASVADVRLIRQQVDRCRSILDQMAAGVGTSTGEGLAEVTVEELIRSAMDNSPERGRIHIEIDGEARKRQLHIPIQALAQVVRNLLKNARDASSDVINFRLTVHDDCCRIEVEDAGTGMPPEVLARAGEPFFTTKEPGEGMGMGLFLARAVSERLGGQFEIESTEGKGTTATLVFPTSDATTCRIAYDAEQAGTSGD